MENKTKKKDKTIQVHSTGYKIMLVLLLVFYLFTNSALVMLSSKEFNVIAKTGVFVIETAGVIFMLLYTLFAPASKGQMLFASEENPTKIPLKKTLIFILLTSLIFGFVYPYASVLIRILFGHPPIFVKLNVTLILKIFLALILVVASFIIMLTAFIISWIVAKHNQPKVEVAGDE